MKVADKKVYSDFEVKDSAIRFEADEKAERLGCVGTMEEAMDVRTITKKCEGIEETVSVTPTGTGELTLSLHMRWDLYVKAMGMDFEELKSGIYAYGQNSRHKEFCLTNTVVDEYGRKKYKAYPRSIISEGKAMKIENGGEEVAQIDLKIKIMPDERGNGTYEALEEKIGEDKTILNEWIEKFNADSLFTPTA